MLQTNVGQFQRDYNLGRVPVVLPAVVLEAMWDVPASEPLIPTKYTISWNGNVFYDTRIDCPSEMLRFPTRAIADLADGALEMTPVPREASDAATIYEENIQTRQWDSSRSQWIVTIETEDDLTKIVRSERDARHTYRFSAECPVEISSLMLSRRQVQVWKLLRGSLTEFWQTLNAEGMKENFQMGNGRFKVMQICGLKVGITKHQS